MPYLIRPGYKSLFRGFYEAYHKMKILFKSYGNISEIPRNQRTPLNTREVARYSANFPELGRASKKIRGLSRSWTIFPEAQQKLRAS